MNTTEIDLSITDYAIGLLLRYFRSTDKSLVDRPLINISRDREILRLHWALSPVVCSLVSYILEHKHEIQSTLSTAIRHEDGLVRGKLDALATLKLRRTSGLSTAIVSHEPLRSYDSGPNQVLGWVLFQVWTLASRFMQFGLNSISYQANIDLALREIEKVRRIQAVAQITAQITPSRRPTAHAVVAATRSRRELYRRAALAYQALIAIESGDVESIVTMLKHTLLTPLEPWRRFELAVAYAVADTLAACEKSQLKLNTFIADVKQPIALAGRFAIYWQWRTHLYETPLKEPSEIVVENILSAWSLSSASDRPDLVVVDQDKDEVVAIIEVKYLTGEDASDRVRGAVGQVVRYARGYSAIDEAGELLGKCLIAVSQGLEAVTAPYPLPDNVPTVVDFEGIKHTALQAWSHRLLGSA